MIDFEELNGKIISVPQSAGINSAAALCRLIEAGVKPKELHIYYAHFEEHSPGSLEFVEALIELAIKSFPVVKYKITQNSVLNFFEKEKMIPHPKQSPCSLRLKINPLTEYNYQNLVDIDLIGYIKSEKKRIDKHKEKSGNDLFLSKGYPVQDISEEECFDLVKRVLGWYPKIYDLRWDDLGFSSYIMGKINTLSEDTQRKLLKKLKTKERVFTHNNCLPCKNMYIDDMLAVEYFYPDYMKKANELSGRLNAYWGRNADQYYTTFGKQDWEDGQCEVCKFD